MRFLTLTNCLLDDAQGSGYVALRYAAGLRARGHAVEILGPAEYDPLYPRSRWAIRYRQILGMAWTSLRRLLCAADPGYDVLEYYGGEAWLAIALLARWPGRRFLLAVHSNGIEPHCEEVLRAQPRAAAPGTSSRRWYRLELGRLAAAAFRNADALLTVADYDRDYALDHGYLPADRVVAIENPLPDAYLGRPVDFARGPVLGFCGTWISRKGIDLLTRDIPPLLRELADWRFVLVGVGDGFRAADHFPADVLARIEVVPHAARDSGLLALYQTFSILLMPSLYESFGLTAAEAMACGAALVATPVGLAAALRPREEAMLLDPAAPSLDAAVRELAADEGLRRRIAEGGYRRVQNLRWDAAVERAEAAYAGWLAALRAGGGAS